MRQEDTRPDRLRISANRLLEKPARLRKLPAGEAGARTPVEEKLRRQVVHVNRNHSWTGLAGQWVEWLSRVRAGA
jgi:hypothetical protein